MTGGDISPYLLRPVRSEAEAGRAWDAYRAARDKLTVIDLDAERRLREYERAMEGEDR